MTKANPLPSQAELDELFSYEPLTGVLRHKKANARYLGKEAGTIKTTKGYRVVHINGTNYRAQRVIWMLVYGVDPGEYLVDHKDTDRLNNRLTNLRLANHSQSNANCRGWSRSGLPKGVRRMKGCKARFEASITANKVFHYLGSFPTPALAHEAYCAAAKQHFGEFWRAA